MYFLVKLTSPWKWRKLCCMPNIILFEMSFLSILLVIFAVIVVNDGTLTMFR